jgi:hypothetical protein
VIGPEQKIEDCVVDAVFVLPRCDIPSGIGAGVGVVVNRRSDGHDRSRRGRNLDAGFR